MKIAEISSEVVQRTASKRPVTLDWR